MNPFDDDVSNDDAHSNTSSLSGDEVWEECRGSSSFPYENEQAFASPLANALVEELGPRQSTTAHYYDDETSSLLQSPASRLSQWYYKANNNYSKPQKSRVVLAKLDQTAREDDHPEHSDNKMIRLENVGTAKSWLILLLPYFAVTLCLLLESNHGFQISRVGPIHPSNNCFLPKRGDTNSSSTTLPRTNPASDQPCSYYYDQTAATLPTPWNNGGKEPEDEEQPSLAVFDTGVMTTIPPAVDVLFADATFSNLSLPTLSSIYHGKVSVSGLLLEQDGDQWNVVANSNTEVLTLACHASRSFSSWACNSPKLMEILLFLPGSAILSGNPLRIHVLFSYNPPAIHNEGTYVYGTDRLYRLLESVDPRRQEHGVLTELETKATYSIYHTNALALGVDAWGRLVLIAITLAFTVFWLYKLGCGRCQPCHQSGCYDEDTWQVRKAMALLDSPWVSFPERWYILVMLLSLVLIQGPLVVLMHFFPAFNTRIDMKTASDTGVGIGVNGVLFGYLCLLQGFGYHTAQKTRQWMHHQRKIVELRRAAKYVVPVTDGEDAEEATLRYVAEHFDLHGDTEGTLTLVNLRLFQDPFGHDWADFLLPKLLLFVFGVSSIWLAAYTRFHFTSDAGREVSPTALQAANSIYLLSYLVHFSVLLVWLALIFRSSFRTGEALRREPFLSTRAAQLAYRVVFAHIALGFLMVAIASALWLEDIPKQWRGGEDGPDWPYSNGSGTAMDFWLQTIERILLRFPYSGTASSIGIGRIFFATVTILIAGFIFLPHKVRDELEHDFSEDKGGKLNREEQLQQRRDKRAVVSLVKGTHTWRVLPLPMERTSAVLRIMLQQKFYQLHKNGKKDYENMQDAGVVYMGQYIPVFCIELACWMHEASFQAYYSPKSVQWNDSSPGMMNLASIGLRLESAIFDDATNTQAIVATNAFDQTEGIEDSLIVVSFRGSVDAANLRTDLKSGMVALPDQMIGFDKAPFRVSTNGVFVEDSDGWLWDAHSSQSRSISCYSAVDSSVSTECFPFGRKRKAVKASSMSSGAMAVLSATPIARNTLPCVHEGFNEVYTVIRKSVMEAVLPVLQRQLSKLTSARVDECDKPLVLPKVFVTGHSLGGALAQLFSLDLASNCDLIVDQAFSSKDPTNAARDLFQLPSHVAESGFFAAAQSTSARNGRLHLQPPIAVYTFGQPRVGNRAFATLYKQRVPHTFRVTVEGDPITALPQVACAGIYKPAGLEVVLDEGTTGNILVGPTVVETLFRFHNVRTDFAAHSTSRYRDCLESALAPHELQEYYKGHNSAEANGTSYSSVQRPSTSEVPDWMTQGRSSSKRDLGFS